MNTWKKFILLVALILTFFPSQPLTASTDPYPNLLGCTGDNKIVYYTEPPMISCEIFELEERLWELGYNPGLVDGKFDSATDAAVKKLQMDTGLAPHGKVDARTWRALARGTDKAVATKPMSPPGGELKIVIDIDKRTLTILADGQVFKEYPVAIGKSKTPSPVGEWKIVQKSIEWGGGFGTRWLGLNVPWGIYGIHGTNKPWSIGRSASHGCFRMFNRDVEEIYSWIKYGTPVIVKGQKLPVPGFRKRDIKPGASGPDVVTMQLQLKEAGLLWGPADGRYGKLTEIALKYFQTLHGLENNGIFEEKTKRALEAE
ncbi:MAG TPA: L,D-transpeptidase family protein [Clostridia bacterium]|nr:L,D-transpeptidase family protein [Clostridia bacterium]